MGTLGGNFWSHPTDEQLIDNYIQHEAEFGWLSDQPLRKLQTFCGRADWIGSLCACCVQWGGRRQPHLARNRDAVLAKWARASAPGRFFV